MKAFNQPIYRLHRPQHLLPLLLLYHLMRVKSKEQRDHPHKEPKNLTDKPSDQGHSLTIKHIVAVIIILIHIQQVLNPTHNFTSYVDVQRDPK